MPVALTRRRWRGLNRIRIERAQKALGYLQNHFNADPTRSVLTIGGLAAAAIVQTDLTAALAATNPR